MMYLLLSVVKNDKEVLRHFSYPFIPLLSLLINHIIVILPPPVPPLFPPPPPPLLLVQRWVPSPDLPSEIMRPLLPRPLHLSLLFDAAHDTEELTLAAQINLYRVVGSVSA